MIHGYRRSVIIYNLGCFIQMVDGILPSFHGSIDKGFYCVWIFLGEFLFTDQIIFKHCYAFFVEINDSDSITSIIVSTIVAVFYEAEFVISHCGSKFYGVIVKSIHIKSLI